MYKSIILALAALSSVALAAPADAGTAVTSSQTLSAFDCALLPDWERRERHECHEENREERHDERRAERECRDRRPWERPDWCREYGYKVRDKRAEAVDAATAASNLDCWSIPEWQRRERRECHDINREERHDEHRAERECRDRRPRDRPDWCREYGYRVHDW